MFKRILFSALALTCLFQIAIAQSKISGTVKDSDGVTLPGVSIMEKGTANGSVTDAEGKYTITAGNGAPLVFSYVGMASKELVANNNSTLDVILEYDSKALGEVVVVGYTSSKKEDLTGAIAVVDMAPLKNISSGNPMQALQGRVPGLYIEKTGSPSGTNSRILIRGANTLGNTDPLYIIDGMPTKRPEVFQGLNPNSIESIQVLKDASASSIYGSRASNGVIIVTTKNGSNSNGKISIDFNSF